LRQIIGQKILEKISSFDFVTLSNNPRAAGWFFIRMSFEKEVNFSSGRESLSLVFRVNNKKAEFDTKRELE